jgi:hypothetical protein
MTLLSRVVEPNNLRLLFAGGAFGVDVANALREDATFARVVARSLFSPRARRERANAGQEGSAHPTKRWTTTPTEYAPNLVEDLARGFYALDH